MKYLNKILIEWDNSVNNNPSDIIQSDTVSRLISDDFYELFEEVFNISKEEFLNELKNTSVSHPELYDENNSTEEDKDIIKQWKNFLIILIKRTNDKLHEKSFLEFISILKDFYLYIIQESGRRPLFWVSDDEMINEIFNIWVQFNDRLWNLEDKPEYPYDYTVWRNLFKFIFLYSKTFGLAQQVKALSGMKVFYKFDNGKAINLVGQIINYIDSK